MSVISIAEFSASRYLADLRARSLRVRLDKGTLRVGPQEELTTADIVKIKKHKAELIDLLELEQGLPELRADGSLQIPFTCATRYHHWREDGQSLWTTLAELSAPLASWQRYGYEAADLLTDDHAARCKGAVNEGENFVYCPDCGRYQRRDA